MISTEINRSLLQLNSCLLTFNNFKLFLTFDEQIERKVADVNLEVLEGREHTRLLQQLSSNTATELQGKASLLDVHACVIRKHYDEAVTALGAAIDDKASVGNLHSCVSGLEVGEVRI